MSRWLLVSLLLPLAACSPDLVDLDHDGHPAPDDGQDCDDDDAAVHPGADEWCNGIDDDCDGLVDDEDDDVLGLSTWYTDADGDGHGDPATAVEACEAPTGTVATGTDPDDSNPGDYIDSDDAFVGYTEEAFTGGAGLYDMTEACRDEWAASHVCADMELVEDLPPDPSGSTDDAWVIFTLVDVYTDEDGWPVYVNPLGVETSDLPNCNGGFSSSYAGFSGLTYGSHEQFSLRDCDLEHPAACCGPEEQ